MMSRNASHARREVRAVAIPVLRHRILLNYKAEAEGVDVNAVIRRLIDKVKPPTGKQGCFNYLFTAIAV